MRIRRLIAGAALAGALVGASPAYGAQPLDGGSTDTVKRYDYPAAWLLPLVFIAATGWLARALTRDLNDE